MEYTWNNQPQPPFKFQDQQRGVLRVYPVGDPDFPEGLEEERGVVLEDGTVTGNDQVGYAVMYVVRVDRKYARHGFDDCLREVSEDQMESENG